jgi:UDP-N-acetylglucosamine:LPS N-acetylglucosamine transferase
LSQSPKIDLIFIDSGGGHRAAASALQEAARQQGRDWDLRLRSAQDILDPIDFIRKSTGVPFQDVYNRMLRHGWTLGTAQMIPAMHLVIRLLHREQVRVFAAYWSVNPPDMVVSLIPHYNRAMREALAQVAPEAPFVTVMTDIADYPPHFWIERMDQYLICGSDEAMEQARAVGLPASRILRASGMILHPRFHQPIEVDRVAERQRLGLRADLPTGLVLFGGEGSTEIPKIASQLNEAGIELQLILLCGRHARAAAEVRALEKRIPMFIEGFTRDVPRYMALSDFFIGKPGPGSISEALAMHLPMIVERNAWTLAHERFNTYWVERRGVGIVTESFRQVAGAVRTLLEPGRYETCRKNAAAMRNYAVFEVAEMLETILRTHPGAQLPGTIPALAQPEAVHLLQRHLTLRPH